MAKKGPAIFLVYTDLADDRYEEEFNAWYDTEHLPQLLTLPGMLDAARYVAVKGGPKYLAVYEVESAGVTQTPEFLNRKVPPWDKRMSPRVIGKNMLRIVGPQIFPADVERPDRGMAPALQIGRMSVPESADAEWNAWYNNEYIPGYLKVPGVIAARRFRVTEGNVGYTTMYEFENEHVSETPEWSYQQANSSPNSERMRATMTHSPGSAGVYRRITP